ncbi:hypothetical protein [Candidatus Methylobacter favarea]|uniref:hypothetical protein n=1 Tax=Candidatus Methylobacter favarea TaxID=2707345 RepID=UPI00157D2222|nr:hypothetical protein [Candidatus Methylobacter favarea]
MKNLKNKLLPISCKGALKQSLIADELNLSVFTLRGGLKLSRSTPATKPINHQWPIYSTRAQRFESVVSGTGFEGRALNTFCRERSLIVSVTLAAIFFAISILGAVNRMLDRQSLAKPTSYSFGVSAQWQ